MPTHIFEPLLYSQYRNRIGRQPITEYERRRIVEPLLSDSIVTKMIGLNMLTDGKDENNFLGYLLASGGHL